MKKVIKPSKQPTKKRSKRSKQTAETAKLKIAIDKISTQLVKDHPKLIKGGGSLGITELLFSKILIKGGKLSQQTRGYIITFLKDIAPQVNKLKQELITKLLEHLIGKDIIDETNIFENIIDINKEFVKDLYEYDIRDDIQDQIGALSEEIKEYIAILDIVKKYYILSRVKDDDEQASIINKIEFDSLPENILKALKSKNQKLFEEYFEKKKIDKEETTSEYSSQTLIDILNRLKKEIDIYIMLFTLSDKLNIQKSDNKIIFVDSNIILTANQNNKLQDLNSLYELFYTNIFSEFQNISNKYKSDDIMQYKITEGNRRSDIAQDLDTLLKLNETFKQIYNIRKDDIKNYLDIIDPERHKVSTTMEVESGLSPDLKALNTGWDNSLVSPPSSPRIGGNPAKYKSTGQVVYIMYQNKKYKRVIYVKDKRNTRYCKINKEYILLSKLKVIQLH
jgi:hypothetical protein